jgi:hypothetical protein
MIEHMQGRGGVWFATLHQIAEHIRAVTEAGTYVPRRVDMPYYDRPLAELERVLEPG